MLKRILAILIVLVFLFSFSTAALANPGQGSENSAQLVFNEDGKLLQVKVPVAKERANENSEAANNPIDVAGKKFM